MSDRDRRPAGDPRDPRGDLRRSRRRVPRLSLGLLAVLATVLGVTQRRLLLADPRATLGALVFAAVLVGVLVGGLLWADRRWPQRPSDHDR